MSPGDDAVCLFLGGLRVQQALIDDTSILYDSSAHLHEHYAFQSSQSEANGLFVSASGRQVNCEVVAFALRQSGPCRDAALCYLIYQHFDAREHLGL